MEIEILVTGIAGQGIQLAAKSIALAAALEGREVMLCPEYGGSMRGGSSLAQIALGDEPLRALPVFHRAAWALAVHDEHFAIAAERLHPDATVVVNSTLATNHTIGDDFALVEVPATRLATDSESPNGAALTLVSSFASLVGLVTVDSLVAAMAEQIPPYRRQHIEANERAIRAGAAFLPRASSVWQPAEVSTGMAT